jgi:glycosyltransferase involved in cell wall biosynthesis
VEERPADGAGPAVKVVFLTTSYPRDDDDYAGRFAADLAERLRGRGVGVDVVAPGAFDDHGLAYGDGVTANVRRRPWALPPMLGSMARAVRRAARDADLVHAFWLPNAAVALAARKPVVVTLPGTDMELARKAPRPAGWVLRRVRVALPVAEAFAEQARRLGAADVRVVPTGLDLPPEPGEAADPPVVLYAGRLSEEKGVEELAAAADGLGLEVAGDGPLRSLFPQARGMLPRDELYALMRRASVVICPSRRDGLPVVCAEAMAHARPVVAAAVGGLPDMVTDGETGLLVPPRDSAALRAAIDRLLADADLRRRLGQAARARIGELCAWDRILDRTIQAYQDAVR